MNSKSYSAFILSSGTFSKLNLLRFLTLNKTPVPLYESEADFSEVWRSVMLSIPLIESD